MSAPAHAERGFGDRLEETLIALILGLMTVITFANVVARFLNSNILWALEATVFLFAWLVLLGASYAFKHTFHIGVDILVRLLAPAARRWVTLLAVLCCLAFSLLLLVGSWNYWWPFASTRAFYEVNDIPMPGFLQFLAEWRNEGERYEKMPRMIPYAVLPLSMALLTWRVIEVGIRVWRGEQDLIVESHEVEDVYEERVAGVPATLAGDFGAAAGAIPGLERVDPAGDGARAADAGAETGSGTRARRRSTDGGGTGPGAADGTGDDERGAGRGSGAGGGSEAGGGAGGPNGTGER